MVTLPLTPMLLAPFWLLADMIEAAADEHSSIPMNLI